MRLAIVHWHHERYIIVHIGFLNIHVVTLDGLGIWELLILLVGISTWRSGNLEVAIVAELRRWLELGIVLHDGRSSLLATDFSGRCLLGDLGKWRQQWLVSGRSHDRSREWYMGSV